MVPPIVGDRLHALVPAAQLVRLPEASHFAHIDAADRFVAAVRPFLDSVKTSIDEIVREVYGP